MSEGDPEVAANNPAPPEFLTGVAVEPLPEALPAPTPVATKKYVFVLTADGQSAPTIVESNDLCQLAVEAEKELLRAKRGHAIFIIDGQVCPICQPKQEFAIKMPDGSFALLNPLRNDWVSDSKGRFTVLVEPPEGLEG